MMPVPGGAARRTTLPAPKRHVHVVVQRTAFAERNANHVALCRIGRLADRFRHFAGLARAVADATTAVTDHDQGPERKPPAALHHLGDTIDVHELVDQLVILVTIPFALAIAVTSATAAAATAATGTAALFTPGTARCSCF